LAIRNKHIDWAVERSRNDTPRIQSCEGAKMTTPRCCFSYLNSKVVELQQEIEYSGSKHSTNV